MSQFCYLTSFLAFPEHAPFSFSNDFEFGGEETPCFGGGGVVSKKEVLLKKKNKNALFRIPLSKVHLNFESRGNFPGRGLSLFSLPGSF